MKTFKEFRGEEHLDESIFGKLASMFSNVANLFKDKEKLEKSVTSTMEQMGEEKTSKFDPKKAKVKDSFIIQMGDVSKPETKYTMSLTKIADLPDDSSLFQITGTTSKEMLKSLVGSDKIEDLTKNSIMAIISMSGLEKDKVATMKLLKNVIPGGKDYVTKVPVLGAVPAEIVETNASKIK